VGTAAPNRGGRPKVAEPGVPISTRISPRDYDAIATAAAREGVSVAAFVRATLRSAIRPPRE
jgi:predicted HicB family RNase H-like nuclease